MGKIDYRLLLRRWFGVDDIPRLEYLEGDHRAENNILKVKTKTSWKVLAELPDKIACLNHGIEKKIFVLTSRDGIKTDGRNIFCLDVRGKILWQIEKAVPSIKAYSFEPFVDVGILSPFPYVYTKSGFKYEVNLETGKITEVTPRCFEKILSQIFDEITTYEIYKDNYIVLQTYQRDDKVDGQNIILFDMQGNIIWRIEPVKTKVGKGFEIDRYVGFSWKNDKLKCTTMIGCFYDVDLATGKIKYLGWSK